MWLRNEEEVPLPQLFYAKPYSTLDDKELSEESLSNDPFLEWRLAMRNPDNTFTCPIISAT